MESDSIQQAVSQGNQAMEIKVASLLIKAEEVSDSGQFKGYASVFGLVDQKNDTIHYGAFRRSLREKGLAEVKILWSHDFMTPIGLPTVLEERKKGLYSEGQILLDLEDGKRVHTLMKHGVVDRLSIGFNTYKDQVEWISKKDQTIRHLKEDSMDLWEYSPVTFAANPKARITSVKSAASARELESALCDAGLSNAAAKYLAARHRFTLCESGTDQEGLCDAGSDPFNLHAADALAELVEALKTTRKHFAL